MECITKVVLFVFVPHIIMTPRALKGLATRGRQPAFIDQKCAKIDKTPFLPAVFSAV